MLAAVTLPLGARAQEIRLGTEFQVNTYSTKYQVSSSVAVDADGDFIVVWQSYTQDGSNYGIFGRRFSSAGSAVASEFQVNTYTTNAQIYPTVAADADGDFIVTWASNGQDGSSWGVFARRFSSGGSGLASEFQVHSYTTNIQQRPAVAADADGDFVVAWRGLLQDGSNYGVFARRFSSAGSGLASEFEVNSYTTNVQSQPAVAADADGDFVVAWESLGQDGSMSGVFARRFSSTGSALASEFEVNSYTTNMQQRPAVAADADGDFVVAWRSYGQDGSSWGVFARRFSSAGSALAGEFQVNSYTTDGQVYPAVAADADGGLVVAWQSNGQDGSSWGVFARRFSSAGSALASEFQVNSYATNYQVYPAVAADADGDFVVAWQSNDQDGSSFGVFAQRFRVSVTLDIDGNGVAQPLTDGLLTLRYLFGFRGAVLVTGAVDPAGCTRCDAASIEAYVAGLISAPAQTIRQGTEFQVHSYTVDHQAYPAVAVDADDDFIVAWESYGQDGSTFGVFARRFSSAGSALASEFQANTYTADYQFQPRVAADVDGDFIVAWTSKGQDGSDYGVFARRFSSAGSALAGEFQVNTYTTSYQRFPTLAADADGDFVVAWQSSCQDGSGYGVFARRFSSSGSALAAEFQVHSYTYAEQRFLAVAADADGDFIVAWQNSEQDGSGYGVFARRFSSSGSALASEFQVNSHSANSQLRPTVAADADGDFVVAWHSDGQDGSGSGVFAQRFRLPVTLDVDGNGAVQPLTDGLLALRYLFGFRGVVLATGAVDLAGCTRCDAASIEAYLAGLTTNG